MADAQGNSSRHSLRLLGLRKITLSDKDPSNHEMAHFSGDDCELFRDLISAGLDGEVDSVEGRALNDHLTRCTGCATYKRALGTIWDSAIGPTSVSDRDEHYISQFSGEVLLAAAKRHRAELRLRHRRRRLVLRFAIALVPLAASATFLSAGAFAHTHIVPTHSKTPCTRLLATSFRHPVK